ncbi:MAG: aminotransferase class III-fold pyridoxal phosphate-dependent enzyme [Gemmatimonas sp.]|nr:aminotransferase class III-fold pyridoxal phosphate-dependent enzyme [Gemmatimonas sp.]
MTTTTTLNAMLLDKAQQHAPKSAEMFEEAKRRVPGGAVRNRFWWPLPIYVERGEGPYVFDIDEHRYIDCNLAFGPLVLGHRHPAVTAAIEDQLARGVIFGAPSSHELELAGLITEHVVGADWLCFLNSGTEAVHAAIRIARAASGRSKVGKFEGGWHGWTDTAMASFGRSSSDATRPGPMSDSLGVPDSALAEMVVLPYNDFAAIDIIKDRAGEMACVIIEAVQGGAGGIPSRSDFLRAVETACRQCGVYFILDEVVTGFRLGASGAAGLYDVTPDLTTLGKAIGGGLPIGAVCGKEELRNVIEKPGAHVVIAGTFSANPVTLAAGQAQLMTLLESPHTYPELNSLGERLREGVQAVCADEGVKARVTGEGSLWGLHVTDVQPSSMRDRVNANHQVARALPMYLNREGVMMSGPIHLGFLSTEHTPAHVDQIVEAHRRAFAEMRKDGLL